MYFRTKPNWKINVLPAFKINLSQSLLYNLNEKFNNFFSDFYSSLLCSVSPMIWSKTYFHSYETLIRSGFNLKIYERGESTTTCKTMFFNSLSNYTYLFYPRKFQLKQFINKLNYFKTEILQFSEF